MGFVMRMIGAVVGMVDWCAVAQTQPGVVFCFMSVSVVMLMLMWSALRCGSAMESHRKCGNAMGVQAPDSGDERSEQDHHQYQPPHAQRWHASAHGRSEGRGHDNWL